MSLVISKKICSVCSGFEGTYRFSRGKGCFLCVDNILQPILEPCVLSTESVDDGRGSWAGQPPRWRFIFPVSDKYPTIDVHS